MNLCILADGLMIRVFRTVHQDTMWSDAIVVSSRCNVMRMLVHGSYRLEPSAPVVQTY